MQWQNLLVSFSKLVSLFNSSKSTKSFSEEVWLFIILLTWFCKAISRFLYTISPAVIGSNKEQFVPILKGSFASFEVTPSLTDSNQATITMSTQGDYKGPFAD